MTYLMIAPLNATEYAPYYAKYVSLVPGADILATLRQQLDNTLTALRNITEAQANFRYASDKWSIKELIGHVNDTERIFGYRALRFARGDQTALPGFEQDGYVSSAAFDERSVADLAAEFEHVRQSTLFLFQSFKQEGWERTGTASESAVSVRALAYIIAGHELHHMNILRDRYLS